MTVEQYFFLSFPYISKKRTGKNLIGIETASFGTTILATTPSTERKYRTYFLYYVYIDTIWSHYGEVGYS